MDTFPIVKTSTVEIKGKTKGGKIKVVKYDRSFLSLIIQNPKAKGFYNDLKNYFLTYERVRARTAWGAENFMVGSEAAVRLIMRAGTLCVLLALDPHAYNQKDYPHLDYSASREYRSTPFFVPVRNAADLKLARRMASEAFTQRCVYTMEFPARTDYVAALPMQKDEALVKKGFIKKTETDLSEADAKKAIAEAMSEEASEEKELEFFDKKKSKKKQEEPPVEEPIEESEAPAEVAESPVEAPAEDSAEEGAEDEIEPSDEEDVIFEIADDGVLVTIYFDRSFTARIIQNERAKYYYGEIKNYALSFGAKSRRVKSRISWRADRFYCGRTPYFYAKVRGKTLCLYLALDPTAYEERIYHHVDVSDKKCYQKTPMMIRVRSDLGLKKAKSLLAEMLGKDGFSQGELATVDYPAMYPYEETDALIERNLIKRVERKPWEAPINRTEELEEVLFDLVEEPIEEALAIAETPTEEPEPEEVVFDLADEPIEAEPQEEIEEETPEEIETEPQEPIEATEPPPETESEEPEEVEFELEDEESEDAPEEEDAEEDDSEEVDFELAEDGEDADVAPVEDTSPEEDAEEISFELIEEEPEPPIEDRSGMEAYTAEERMGRYVTLKKYVRGFTAKMRQGIGERKDYYARIKAKLLSYKGVKLSESFSGDTFKKGSKTLLKSRIRGKTLCLFYALNPDDYKLTIYHQQYKGDTKAYVSTPMMIRVRSEQGMKRALRLIEEMERIYLLTAGEHVSTREVRQTYVFEATDALVAQGLIKTRLVTVTEYEAQELLKKKMK